MNVCLCEEDVGGSVLDSGREMRIGTWSELSVVRVDQEAVKAMSGVDIDRSGEVGLPLVGILVGVLVFRGMEEDCDI